MIIRALHLRPYGAFDDRTLEFGAKGGLHLVYGPNGAGKSTTLAALRAVLFGMKPGDMDFRFVSRDLRLGAHLVHSGGAELRYTRRTSRKTPLWTEDDDQPLAEEQLAPFLGGLDGDQFKALFGLDLEEMVAGGRQLLAGQGEIGRSIFGAGIGGERLARIERRLDEETRGLFLKGSSKPLVNRLLAEHKAISTELRAAIPSVTQVDRQRKELAELEAGLERTELERAQLARSRRALDELYHASAALRRLDKLERERETIGPEAPLPADAVTDILTLCEERAELGKQRTDAARRERKRAGDRERHGIRARVDVLDASAAIDGLGRRLDAYLDAVDQRPQADDELRASAAKLSAAQNAAGLGGSAATEPIEREPLRRHRTALDSAALAVATARDLRTDAEVARATAEREAAGLEDSLLRSLRAELETLAPFQGSIADLEAAAPPPRDRLDARRRDEEQLERSSRDLAARRERLDERERDGRRELESVVEGGAGAPPTRARLVELREERDRMLHGWFGAKAPIDATGAASLERALRDADELADRLHDDADRARRADAARRVLAEVEAARSEIDAERKRVETRRDELESAWTEVWQPCGFAPADSATMADWVRSRAALLATVDMRRSEAANKVADARALEERRVAELAAAREDLAEVQSRWERWAREVGLDPAAGPIAAEERLDAHHHVSTLQQDTERLRGQLAALSETIGSFEREINQLGDDLSLAAAPSGETPPCAALAAEITRALADARDARAALSALDSIEREESSEDERRALRTKEIEGALEAHRSTLDLPTLDDLLARAKGSDAVRSLDESLAEARVELADAASGRTEDEIRAALGERTAEELRAELEALDQDAKALESAATATSRRIGEARAAVEGDGSDDAARLLARRSELEAELSGAVEQLLSARIASYLLDREINAFQKTNQVPTLERAQHLFETLTLGAFVQLHPSADSHGREVIVARRPDDRRVGVEGMSTGTRDQLYLALRIAVVENTLAQQEPMPFIADDLFVNFDDQRTEAALRVLAELAEKTQVIVFSHHRSVVETAERLTDDGVPVAVHHLGNERDREAGEAASPSRPPSGQ